MLIQESHVNASDGYRLSESVTTDLKDTYLGEDASVGDIYRASVREHGRCTGKVYVGDGVHVGWVFVKRDEYEDAPRETFLHETWITLLDSDETVRNVEYHTI
jgi:hypothetical protein